MNPATTFVAIITLLVAVWGALILFRLPAESESAPLEPAQERRGLYRLLVEIDTELWQLRIRSALGRLDRDSVKRTLYLAKKRAHVSTRLRQLDAQIAATGAARTSVAPTAASQQGGGC